MPSSWVDIDRAFATPNGVFAPLTDVRGPIEVGDVVNVQEKSSRKTGGALVTGIDGDNVYLSLVWDTLTDAYSTGANRRYAREVLG
jgi:hypothetical protein